MFVEAVAGGVDREGVVHAAYGSDDSSGSFFRYDSEVIAANSPELIALSFDSLNRPLLAYVAGSDLTLCYRDGATWRFLDVGVGAQWLDVLVDSVGRPVIAYFTGDAVFTATGVDVLGQSEESAGPVLCRTQPLATIVRGALELPRSTSPSASTSWLLDISGCRALDLHAGSNDVSRLAPGVYFVRSGPLAVSRQSSAVTKVVITR